ncbi:peroxisomal biogenesis factor 2 [Calycina marina]|uniref:Peroxisomal biogenesis factor 2 n=1 Tax=Calycina marina TaxID=1763456 RepID=A0A9P7YV68_9HELO|nr:peroxisomal biogenesis factor 2 [Calycina marina]
MASNDFALAQERIVARRELRVAQLKSSVESRQAASRTAEQISRLPAPLRPLGFLATTTWNRISARSGTQPAFRVGQVDAELLDEELLGLLKTQVAEGLKYYGSHIQDDWSAEITLALRAILFKVSIWDKNATYGAALQNLHFTDARKGGPGLAPPSKWQKSMYGLFTVGGNYAWTKWENWLVEQDDGYGESNPTVEALSSWSGRLENIHATAAFASFLIFLVNGRYRTLLDRILKLRLTPPTSQVSREVSFEYLNRQLVWHAFTEFLLFVLPLVGISRWRRWLSRAWRKTKSLAQSGGEEEAGAKTGEYAFLSEPTCAICYQDINPATASEADVIAASGAIGSALTSVTNPYEAVPCGCVYCYVCIVGRLEAEDGEPWTCLRCGTETKECKPWGADVVQEMAKPTVRATGTRNVSFHQEPVFAIHQQGSDDDGEDTRFSGEKCYTETHDDSSSEHLSEGEEAFDEIREGEVPDDDDDD